MNNTCITYFCFLYRWITERQLIPLLTKQILALCVHNDGNLAIVSIQKRFKTTNER